MKINDYIIRSLADGGIVTHKDYGLDNKGNFIMNETATYHGSIEEALRSVRKRLRAACIKPEMNFDGLFTKLKKIDEKFVNDLKNFELDIAFLLKEGKHSDSIS